MPRTPEERLNEDTLIQAAKSGDPQAFRRLIAPYQAKLCNAIRRFPHCQQAADAEDIWQEVCLKIYLALPLFRSGSQFYTWAYKIMQHTVYDKWSAREPESAFDEAWHDKNLFENATDHTPDTLLIQEQTEKILWHALQALPPHWKSMWILREIQGMSYQEIAQQLERPIGSVRSGLARTREALAQSLQQQTDHISRPTGIKPRKKT